MCAPFAASCAAGGASEAGVVSNSAAGPLDIAPTESGAMLPAVANSDVAEMAAFAEEFVCAVAEATRAVALSED